MKENKSAIKPVLIALTFFILIAIVVYWLWQRQPKPSQPQPKTPAPEVVQKKLEETQLEITPASGRVLAENNVTFQGKTHGTSYIIISASHTLGITQANENGEFKIDAELAQGLNLIDVIAVDQNLAELKTLPLALYVDPDSNASTVLTGPVKSIFDNIITITTTQGEQTIRQKSSTKLILPEAENDKEDGDIRVGDFLIALGEIENEKDFDTSSIEVIREEKPQNNEKYVAGVLLTKVNKNIFSVRNQKDSQIVEFNLSKDSKISKNGEDAQIEDIAKDKKAIIVFYTKDNENTADLIYLIP